MYIWIDLSVRRFGNKMSIKSNLRKTRPIHQQTLRHLCMCLCKGVFINSYRYLCICWYLALSMYVCLYVYIQLCIYRFFYLSEGLTTKWASTPTFDKPEPFSKRPFKIYVCIDLRVGVTCEREMKRTNPMHGQTHKIQLAIAKDPLYRKNQQTMCIQDPTHISLRQDSFISSWLLHFTCTLSKQWKCLNAICCTGC